VNTSKIQHIHLTGHSQPIIKELSLAMENLRWR